MATGVAGGGKRSPTSGVAVVVGRLARSALHHQGDGSTLSLGPVSMGAKSREQCAVVALSLRSQSC